MVNRALLTLALLALPASAASQRVAVLELRNKLAAAERTSLDASYLADLARAGLLKAAPTLDLMTRENVLVLIQASGKTLEECEGECEVDTARRLGADLVVSGDLLRFGTAYRISLRMHDVHTSRLLGASQASGGTADELAASIPAAMSQLAAVLGPVRPLEGFQRAPWWKQVYLRDAAQLMGGYGYELVGPTSRFGVRAFGVEFHAATSAHFEETIGTGSGSEHHTTDWTGYGVGVSPLSISTGSWGEASTVDLVFFEPFALYQFGTLKKVNGTNSVNASPSGFQFGTRAYLKVFVTRSVGMILGAEVAYGTFSDRDTVIPGSSNSSFGGPPMTLALFGGLALTLGGP